MSQTVLFGGTVALSEEVAQSVPNPQRVAGAQRTETAARIGTDLSGASARGQRRLVIIDGYHPDGWAYGLAAGGLAADADAPPLMVNADRVPDATARLVAGCGQVDLLLVGSESVVTRAAADQLDALDAGHCTQPNP